ncbi:MAG TPA: inositol monophosphatase family protein [Gemmatimonadota bacterium]|nr:inositol monophosphatase family protein [Gemmatimonadota bacterium]
MIDATELAELRAFAIDAARLAGRLTLQYFGGVFTIERKDDASFVTEVDRRAEELLRERLAARCPADGVIGEEFGVSEGESGRSWTVDPIDGTLSFVHGVPLYGVLIGLLDGDEAVLGAMHLPALDETVAAARGHGCQWTRGGIELGPARVRQETAAMSEALVLATDFARLPDVDAGGAFARLARAAGALRGWGDCYGHALVATGRADAMIDPRMKPWDSVPLQPIVEEAGGRFTTLAGERVPAGGSAVSTNGRLHAAILALLDPQAPRSIRSGEAPAR